MIIITGEKAAWDGSYHVVKALFWCCRSTGIRELFVPGLTGEQAGMVEGVARGTSLDDKDYRSQLIVLTSTRPNTLNCLKSIDVAYKSWLYFSCDRLEHR